MFNKKNFVSFLVFTILLFATISSYANNAMESIPPGLEKLDIRILHNGNYKEFDIKPIEKENRMVLAPLRFTLEDAGYKVDWDKSGIVTILGKEDEKIIFDSNKKDYVFENIKGNIMIEYDFFHQFKDVDVNYDPATRTLIVNSKLGEDEVLNYDLGERTMHTKLDRDLTYTLNGGMSIPKTDNNPLVILMHGAHGSTKAKYNRFDLGYSYLLKELAKENYLTVSPNVTIQYSYEDGEPMDNERLVHVFEETLKSLIEANKGSNNFGFDLKNKIDFDNVILVGHSRSGYEIFELNNIYKDDKRIDVKGLLSIAPSRMYEIDYDKVDNPVSIILPELDGDVSSLDGQWIFDEITSDKKRTADMQLVYLYGANHNGFNQSLLIQDEGKSWYTGELKKIKPEEQRDFLVKYSKNYISSVLNNKFIANDLNTKNGKILGYDALVSNYSPVDKIYLADSGKENILVKNVEVDNLVSSYKPDMNTAAPFYHPGDNENLPLLNIKWKEKGGSVAFKIKGDTRDKDILSIYMAQDSTSELNKKEDQTFNLVLKDKNGKTSKVLLDKNTPQLRYVDGEVIFDDSMYSSHTPLSILDVDLNKFKGIDRDNIAQIGFEFSENDSGSIFVRFIQLK